jgi:hypothetical protein
MSKISYIVGGLVIIGLFAFQVNLAGNVSSVNDKVNFLAGGSGEQMLGGTTNFDALELGGALSVGGTFAVTGATTVGGALGVTGATDTSIFTQGGGCTASTTVAATELWTEADMLGANCFEYNGATAAAITITLPATSTMTTLLPNTGDFREWIYQGYTAAATTTTFTAGAGIDLIGVTSNDDVIDGDEYARLSCTRMTDTDVTCIVSELVHVD